MDGKQIKIAAKIFNFIANKPAPGAGVVVFSGAADVTALGAALINLRVIEGSATDVASAVAVFVNSSAEAKAASQVNSRILTIGTDVACVDSGACILVVQTIPKVSVYLNRAAAMAAGIDFDTAFKMLVTER